MINRRDSNKITKVGQFKNITYLECRAGYVIDMSAREEFNEVVIDKWISEEIFDYLEK